MGHLIPSHLHLISTRIWIPILYPSAERLTSRHLTMPLGIPLSIYLSTNPLNRPTNYSKQEEEPFLSHVNRINPGNQRTNQWLTNQNVCFFVHYVQAACLAINLEQLLCFLFPLLSSSAAEWNSAWKCHKNDEISRFFRSPIPTEQLAGRRRRSKQIAIKSAFPSTLSLLDLCS